MFAASTGQFDVVKVLVLAGADPGGFNVGGKGILQLARHVSVNRMHPWLATFGKNEDGTPLVETYITKSRKAANIPANLSNNDRHTGMYILI